MKINIYYGGRGVLDDPTLYVIGKMEEVLTELRVEVGRYNIYENKNSISTLPQTFRDADGIILATTVEWLGIGGYMNQFLDACWLYGDKEAISRIYMQPVVMSTTYGEREAMSTLENAWEILGGQVTGGLCGYIEDPSSLEGNVDYARIMEKKAENLYRTISQKAMSLPTSNQAVTRTVGRTSKLELTPQESEQLSQYVSDDDYVKQQREDIIELSSMFRNMMGAGSEPTGEEFISSFRNNFVPLDGEAVTYVFAVTDLARDLVLEIRAGELSCHYGKEGITEDVYARITSQVMEEIVSGRETFQRAFSVGDMTARGTFSLIRKLDSYFPFS